MIAQLAALTLALITHIDEGGAPVAPDCLPTVEKYLTIRETAERLRCTTDHLYSRKPMYPFIKRRGKRSLIVCPDALARWIASRPR